MTESTTELAVTEIDGKDDIEEQVEELVEQLEEASNSEEATEKLNQLMSELGSLAVERYSTRNQLGLWAQVRKRELDTGKAKYFHGYQTWKSEYGRQVEKGADGFKVLAPIITHKCPECGNAPNYHDHEHIECEALDDDVDPEEEWSKGVVGYTARTVFEYHQTIPITEADDMSLEDVDADEVWEPMEFTAQGDAEALNDAVRSLIELKGIDIEFKERIGNVKGTSTDGTITLSERMDMATETKVLIHELAHELLHWDTGQYPREQKEVEAEAVAYCVCSHFGIETQSEAYVSSWDSEEIDTWKRIEEITDTATEIIQEINE